MDIRDILKSFDNLSEAKTTTDKGTVHKADPGGYGNKHGSEEVTDQWGKPKGKVSLGKLGAQNEPKRGKGRPPNPDKPKEYDTKGLNAAFGIGKAPTPKGKPSVKHSLKEYFDQMDQALVEAGAIEFKPASQMPKQPGQMTQPGQQQQVAGQPQKNTQVIAQGGKTLGTVDDPQLANQIKQSIGQGKMTLNPQQQMEEDGENWIKGAIKHPGAFTKKASSHGMTPAQFRAKVLAHKEDYPAKTEKQAQLSKTLSKMHEAEIPSTFATASPLGSSNNRSDMAFEGKKGVNPFAKKDDKDEKKCPPMTHIKKMCEKGMSVAEICKMHPDCDQKELKQMVADCKKTLDKNKKTVKEARFKQEYRIFLESKGINVTNEMLEEGWKEKLAAAGTAAAIGATSLGMMGGLPGQNPADSSVMRPTEYSQQVQSSQQVHAKAEAMAKVNKQFAKEYQDGYLKIQDDPRFKNYPKLADQEATKFTQQLLAKYQANESKKPDANKNRIPDYAEDGKGPNDTKKKGAAPKKGVNPFAKKDEKKKVKEGMEHHLQAARLEGKSHALRKMPYNCSHDDMEEARCYHDGFKEGLDECYGQMPIVGEMGQGPEVATMASYGADELGEMDKTSYMKQQAIKTPGDTFKAFGQTMRDSNVLDEFAFEALDKQLNAILEGKEVSEGMTVSISKGQQGSPDSVSVSAQDGEADQLLSIIKSAGMGLFGGDEQNGYGAPQGSAGAHGGISVVDDHDGMMALMKKLSGNGGDMAGGGDYEDEEGHEGHSEEEHMHGEEETCESCGGTMEENHQCGSGQQSVMGEDETEDQMTDEVAEANAPDSGADNTNADVAGQVGSDEALATADAAQDMATAKTYSSPTEGKEDTTGEEAGKEKVDEEGYYKDPDGDEDSAADKADKADDERRSRKEETVAESFANLYKKLAFLSEESTEKKDEKAEKAGKKVANDIEYDEGHKGKDDNKAEKAGKKVTKDIEYDDKKDEKYKKDKKVDESYANSADDTFEADIDFMTKVISGGLNKQKSTGQTTVPVISGQKSRMGVDGLGSPMKESNDLLKDYRKLSGL